MKIVAVTACPTGIAHTYMAAEQLEKTAKALGHTIRVETQGAMGIENELSKKDIAEADVAIFAVDIEVERATASAQEGDPSQREGRHQGSEGRSSRRRC
jgi:fructose-specific phosphotransferase system IIB component